MTFNVLSADLGRAGRPWAERRPLVAALLARERPTVLCTQEGTFRQLLDIRDDLDGYDWIHLGRDGGSSGEATAVLWDSSRLDPLEYDHLWVSRRPRSIGSRSWGSRTVRMLTWVRFADRATDRAFYVVDNHLDHRSERARRKGARFNVRVLAGFADPAIVAGDFNCPAGSRAHRILLQGGLTDAWDAAEERPTPEWGTYNRRRPEPEERTGRIDWVLTGPGFKVHRAAVNAYAEDGITPSDHWPVQALVSLT